VAGGGERVAVGGGGGTQEEQRSVRAVAPTARFLVDEDGPGRFEFGADHGYRGVLGTAGVQQRDGVGE